MILRDYVDAIRVLASRLATPLADLDNAFRQHGSRPHLGDDEPLWQSLLLDGIHPNDAGHRLAAELLFPLLNQTLADL